MLQIKLMRTPYTSTRKINGTSIPILRDTGATADVVCQKYVSPESMAEEHVWVQYLLNKQMSCLPMAEIEIDCQLGHVTTKAAIL